MLDYVDSDLDLDDDDDLEAIGSLLSDLGEDDDYGEKKKRKSGRAPARRGKAPAGTGKGLYKTPASKEYVTQAQLRASLAEVTKNFEKTAAGVTKLDADVTALASRLAKADAVNEGQTTALGKLKKDNDKTKEFFLFMSLLGGFKKVKATEDIKNASGTVIVPKDTELPFAPAGDKIDKLLPLMLLGAGGNGNGGGGMFDNPLMLVLMLDGFGS
jgi:hypothetical protein